MINLDMHLLMYDMIWYAYAMWTYLHVYFLTYFSQLYVGCFEIPHLIIMNKKKEIPQLNYFWGRPFLIVCIAYFFLAICSGVTFDNTYGRVCGSGIKLELGTFKATALLSLSDSFSA